MMELMKKIGNVIGWLCAALFFVVCVVVTAPYVIAKVAIQSFKTYFNEMSNSYNGKGRS